MLHSRLAWQRCLATAFQTAFHCRAQQLYMTVMHKSFLCSVGHEMLQSISKFMAAMCMPWQYMSQHTSSIGLEYTVIGHDNVGIKTCLPSVQAVATG